MHRIIYWIQVCLCLLLYSVQVIGQSASKPDDSRFTKIVLDNDLNEPMELTIAPDGRIYYTERVGFVNRFDPKTNQKKRLAQLPIRVKGEDGLLGIALDPNFTTNHYAYLYFGDLVPADTTYFNVLARFVVTEDSLLWSSRKDLLRIPVLPEGVSHSGGSLTFDKTGNLYLSTGDNTNPFESGGYAPIDGRPGRIRFDAQKSAGNPNDLRGKIIRIHPEPDGTYTIPDGNLFPVGTPGTRPEIYVMGNRNPFRIAVDNHTGFLYWGEVGPDAGVDSLSHSILKRGPRGHDEVNQARRAGYFGWPYFVGNNKPYYAYDFDTGKSGERFDPQAPVNNSPNNTGAKQLPPAQPAFIWYPYAESSEFPQLGTGGRNAMAGPVYYVNDFPANKHRFPAYYDGKLFIYDWMRNWIFTVTMNSASDYVSMERFLPGTTFDKPVDMAFAPDGSLYMLEYGTYWRAKNQDARLVRIEYTEGNRAPIARLSASKTVGAAPLTVRFSATESFDYDKADSLRYTWRFTGTKTQATGPRPSFTFTKPGQYRVALIVTDPQGQTATATQLIRVGNEPPQVTISASGNRSFYLNQKPVNYRVNVSDREDGTLGKTIPASKVQIMAQHLREGYDLAGLAATGEVKPRGLTLIERSDCMACHARDKQSVGPSYEAVAKRYGPGDVDGLAAKVINGGGGVWGKEHVMSAHPQLSKNDAAEMVRYILSLKNDEPTRRPEGVLAVNEPIGLYALTARYTDRGGLMSQSALYLRSPRVPASDANDRHGVAERNGNDGSSTMSYTENGAWLRFNRLDLTGIRFVEANVYSPGIEGTFELRLGSPTGSLIGQWVVVDSKEGQKPRTSITPTTGQYDLYVIFREKKGGISIWKRLDLRWIEFIGE